jgi:hypothetical protein
MESQDFERLRPANLARKTYRVEETPPELAQILIAALDRIIANESDASTDN